MENKDIIIRKATVEDSEQLLSIYAPYVKNTAITFEYDVPSVEEFQRRIAKTLKKYPYIVAEKNYEIIGYAYMGSFVGRAAYDWSAEVSIYLRQNSQKMGIGGMLYKVLEDISKAQNILNLNACIAYSEIEDEHLSKNSVQFHEHLGYEMVGKFHKCGYKFGSWYDMVWMEKMLGKHPDKPDPIIYFPELNKEALQEIGIE